MTEFRPPAPEPRRKPASFLRTALDARRSSIANLTETAYTMKMGHVSLPWQELYTVNEPGLVRRILIEQADLFPKAGVFRDMLRFLIGDGVFASNGAPWRRQRRMIDPAFAQARLEDVFAHMLAAVEAMHRRLDAFADGAAFAADIETTHVTADIIFRTIFSLPIDAAHAGETFEAFERFQANIPAFGLLRMVKLPTLLSPRRYRAERAARRIRALLESFIRPRFERRRSGEASADGDILASLLAARDPETGAVFDFHELVDEVAVLFLAGHETSASALAWALYLLAMRPEAQARLHDELLAVLGRRAPAFSHIKQLKFARELFRETLRLYPPVSFLIREASQAAELRGKAIPPHSLLVVSPWLIHRHRRLWERPDIFDADRLQTAAGKESARSAYLPFGLGPRVCPGAGFAMQEAVLILASLARAYRFDPVPGHIPQPIGRLTIRSGNGIQLILRKRRST